MSSGFRYVLSGALIIAVLFAALSLLPTYLSRQSPTSSTPTTPTPATTTPRVFTMPPVATVPAAAPPMPAVLPGEEEQPGVSWVYTAQPVVLRVKPDGDPYYAASVSSAPLTILGGTRMLSIRSEGDWLMVRVPSRLLGWIPAREVVYSYEEL